MTTGQASRAKPEAPSESKPDGIKLGAKNHTGPAQPATGDTEKIDAKKVQEAWGDLPAYVRKHGRGSMPTVPEKYRKYLDALSRLGNGTPAK